MLVHLLDKSRPSPSARKLRLFAVACCRRAWHLLAEHLRAALDVAEQYADGRASDATRKLARAKAFQAKPSPGLWFCMPGLRLESAQTLAKVAVCDTLAKKPSLWRFLEELDIALAWDAWAAAEALSKRGDPPATPPASFWPAEQLAHFRKGSAGLVRDVFGDPFRPAFFDPSWLHWHDGSLVQMAQTFYDQRTFADLSILADGLEAAGCTDAGILPHCRKRGDHVRGCWVLDLLLEKG
jgi:hypothetical protein